MKTGNREKDLGVKLVSKAMKMPIKQIILNSGEDPEEIISRVLTNRNKHFGYNALTGKFGDLKKEGVIDPVKVVRCALQDAASIAGLVLTTDCLIVNELELNELGVGD